jgi:hypothetical protein
MTTFEYLAVLISIIVGLEDMKGLAQPDRSIVG